MRFDLEPAPSVEEWAERHRRAIAGGYPWLVAEESGEVIGYATASSHRPKLAYRSTVETTIYLAPDVGGRGVGLALYGELLEEAAETFHLAVAGVTLPNPASVALHERLGFAPVGTFHEIGHKHGAWRDVGWWERRLT